MTEFPNLVKFYLAKEDKVSLITVPQLNTALLVEMHQEILRADF